MTGRELINWIHESGLEELPIFRIGRRAIVMNSRQAAKAAAERIKELERVNNLNRLDIIDYNKVIADQICGNSPCPMCEDWEECQLDAKYGKGCSLWMLRSQKVEEEK